MTPTMASIAVIVYMAFLELVDYEEIFRYSIMKGFVKYFSFIFLKMEIFLHSLNNN